MQPGDLVGYKKSEFVSARVHENFVGLVIQARHGGVVQIKWNFRHSNLLWHHIKDLEVVNEFK